jgi:hypothetical protein
LKPRFYVAALLCGLLLSCQKAQRGVQIPGLQGSDTDYPFQITAMVKAPDDPQSRGGWIWVAQDVDSGEQTIVDWEFRFDCHANANEPHPYGDGNTADEFRIRVPSIPGALA